MASLPVSTGAAVLDLLLRGGYEADIVTTIYGPAGSGKTNLCILALLSAVKAGKKAVLVDTEGGFSLIRVEQLYPSYKDVLDRILLFSPTTFEEQRKAFASLRELAASPANVASIGIIIIDSVSMLYRLEVGKTDDIYATNRELAEQVSMLTEIARKNSIPILLTNQVYSSFDEKDKVNMVGGDILKYSSKCLLELQKAHQTKRRIILRKHRSLPEGLEAFFEIKNEGIVEVEF
ncbi:DNA repair and recombination protein RadB [Candidatus Woesearchaeota archaeon]|nr:DNA repair and recombination protein RadB [Candidatus Woesearchaeota archaeon]